MKSLLAAIRDNDAGDDLATVFTIIGCVLLLVAAWFAAHKDGRGTAIAGVAGLVLLLVFWDDADL